jgi:Putative Flp pilus-assembly TadE/G-like
MSRHRNQRGQAMVLTLVFLAVLLGVAAAVIDVGAWYKAHRDVQATADAAALAGATALPESQSQASALALDYANRNGGGVTASDVTFSGTLVAGDTIAVTARKTVPGMFASLFGLGSVTARRPAKAMSAPPGEAKWAAPIAVDILHPKLQCEPLPCFDQQTELELDKVGPGAFHIINIDGSQGGTSSNTIGDWIREGLDAHMPLKWYYSDPGARFNSSHVRNALDARIGEELLFPVYRGVRGQGSGFDYEVVGWVGWHLTGYQIGGKGKLQGWFTRVIWEGISTERSTGDDFGVRAISLVE